MHASALARHQTETELRQAIEGSAHSPRPVIADYDAALGLCGRHGRLDGRPDAHGRARRAQPMSPDSRLELHYQPVVDLASGAVEALEALVRWRHPMRGLVHPPQFLQVAEDSGLIVPLGDWVVAEACHQMVAWQLRVGAGAGDAGEHQPVQPRSSGAPAFSTSSTGCSDETGVPPDLIALEITEGVIMDDIDRAVEMLDELHARHVQVHVDDFGTGYSSLQSLHRLPIDLLKIDKSFVAGLGEDERTAELVRTIVQLGRSIGVGVIAEGVATPEQHRILYGPGVPAGPGLPVFPGAAARRAGGAMARGPPALRERRRRAAWSACSNGPVLERPGLLRAGPERSAG